MKPIATGIRIGGLYKLDVKSTPQQALMSLDKSAENLWHQQLGHINFSDFILLQKKGIVDGIPVFKKLHIDYEACALSKQHRDEFPAIKDRKQRYILELVHTDLCGPMQTRSLGGAYYFLIFVDDCKRFKWVYFLKQKSHAFEYFKQFRNTIEKQSGKFIRILRSNQGGEFKKGVFIKYCKKHGIQQ